MSARKQAPAPLRLAAIVPHTIARRGMEAVFDAAPDVELIQMGVEAADLDAFPPDAFDAVLVVVTTQSGFAELGALAGRGYRILGMGSPEHRDQALAAGAHAFLSGESEPDALIRALVQVATGAPTVSPDPQIAVAIVVSHPMGRLLLAPIFDDTSIRVVAAVSEPDELEDVPQFDVVILGLTRDQARERIEATMTFERPVLCFGISEYRDVALAAGVQGFMRGAESPEEIMHAIEALAAGRAHVPEDRGSLRAVLSPREQQVIHHLARGCTDREIGDELGISMRTVQSHLDRIREKTGRRRRAELTRLALELGDGGGG